MESSISQVEEAAAAAIVAERDAAEARVVAEAAQRIIEDFEGRDVIIVDSPTLTVGFITAVARKLEEKQIRVRVRWARDTSGIINGVSLCERLS